MQRLKGIVQALMTPFKANGDLDYEFLKGGSNLAYYKKALEFRGFKPVYSREPIGKLNEREIEILKNDIQMLEEKYL